MRYFIVSEFRLHLTFIGSLQLKVLYNFDLSIEVAPYLYRIVISESEATYLTVVSIVAPYLYRIVTSYWYMFVALRMTVASYQSWFIC